MINEKRLREKLEWLLGRARYSHISTGARETLPKEIIEIVKECEVPEKPINSKRNTLKTANVEEEPEPEKEHSENWLA
jgi:hypothetical protein